MKNFISSRPLSVLVAFAFLALSLLGSLSVFTRPAFYSELITSSPLYATLITFSLATIFLNLILLVIFYRRPELTLKAFVTGGVINAVACSALTGYPPLGSMLCYSALSGWMAYELYGFNIFEWADAKLGTTDISRETKTSASPAAPPSDVL